MSGDWDKNAKAWIDHLGAGGDFSREYVLDPVMLGRVRKGAFRSALDVGCGEGRFCRMLAKENIPYIGIDPTEALVAKARERDPTGDYRLGRAEELSFESDSFDLVVSYLTLIDIEDYKAALHEMARVLAPGGRLLIANVSSYFSAGPADGVQNNAFRSGSGYAIDRYLEERSQQVRIGKFHVRNWHRPLSAYMDCFIHLGWKLTFFGEPLATGGGDPELEEAFARIPPFVVMEWER